MKNCNHGHKQMHMYHSEQDRREKLPAKKFWVISSWRARLQCTTITQTTENVPLFELDWRHHKRRKERQPNAKQFCFSFAFSSFPLFVPCYMEWCPYSKSTGKSRECVTQLKDFSSIRKWSRGMRARLLAKHLESTMCENSTLLCNLNERITFPKGGWVKWHSGCAKETLIIITVVYPDGGIVLKHMQINLNKSFLICAFCSPICPAPAFGSLTRLLRSTPSSCSPLFKIEILSGYLPFFVCILSIRRLSSPTCSFENPVRSYPFRFFVIHLVLHLTVLGCMLNSLMQLHIQCDPWFCCRSNISPRYTLFRLNMRDRRLFTFSTFHLERYG